MLKVVSNAWLAGIPSASQTCVSSGLLSAVIFVRRQIAPPWNKAILVDDNDTQCRTMFHSERRR